MISSALTCLLLASPQQPTTPPAPLVEGIQTAGKAAPATGPGPSEITADAKTAAVAVSPHANWFPHDTMAVISVAPMARHRHALARTGFAKLFLPSLKLLGRESRMPALCELGLPDWDLRDLLSNGISLGMTGMAGPSRAHWLMVAELAGHGEDVQKALMSHAAHATEKGGAVENGEHGAVTTHTITHRNRQAYTWALLGTTLVVADDVDGVVRAIDRHSLTTTGALPKPKPEPEPKAKAKATASAPQTTDTSGEANAKNTPEPAIDQRSLADSAAYQRFAIRCASEGVAFFTIFIQPQVAMRTVLERLPPAFKAKAEQLTQQLDLLNVSELGFAMFAQDDKIRDLAWLGYPKPLSGLLRTLARGKNGVQLEQHKGIAADVAAVSLSSVHWQQVYQEAIGLARSFNPSIPQQLKTSLESLRSTTGIDIEKALLAKLGDQVLFQEWYSPSGTLDTWGVTVQLREPKEFAKAMHKLAEHFAIPATTILGKPAVLLPDASGLGSDPAAVTGTLLFRHGDRLVAASSPVVAKRIIQTLEHQQGNIRVLAALEALDTVPVNFTWSDCTRYGKQLVSNLNVQWGDPMVTRWLNELLEQGGGEMVSTVETTDQGIAFRSASPYGNLYLTLTAAYFLRSQLKDPTSGGLAMSEDERIQQRQIGLLQEIVAAEHKFQAAAQVDADRDRRGEFTTLTVLLDRGLLDAKRFQRAETPGTCRSGDYLFRVHLPKSTDAREQQLVGFAWPAEQKTGAVFAVTAGGLAHANTIVAHAEGLRTCGPRDFYQRGIFGATLVSGWKQLDAVSARKSLLAEPSEEMLSDAQRQTYAQIAADEKIGNASAEVILLLESANSRIAARTAFAMGQLKCREAVPQLCRMVHEHADVTVQRQAMAALNKIRDQRSKNASIRALASTDVQVRALAATTLASLRATDARDRLLEVLAIDAAEADSADRIATYLALADLGDAKALIPAATSWQPGKQEQQALVYLFQQVSKTMAPADETRTLITVLDSDNELLRRFAIQRLGVLKDPVSAKALEGRLAKETSLQKLVQVSLAAVRGASPDDSAEDILATARSQGKHLWTTASTRWNGLSDLGRSLVMGGGGLFLVLVFWWQRSRRRRRLQAQSDAMVAMVGHSEDFVEDEEYQDEDEEYEDEDGEYEPFDADYEDYDEASSDVEFDESEDFVELESDDEYGDWDETEEEEYDEVGPGEGSYRGSN